MGLNNLNQSFYTDTDQVSKTFGFDFIFRIWTKKLQPLCHKELVKIFIPIHI